MKTQPRQFNIKAERDVWITAKIGSDMAQTLGMSRVDCIRIETAILEMVHNILAHANQGTLTLTLVTEENRQGLCVCAQDDGPGIADVGQALQDGFSTKKSLGIGLGVTKRMMDDLSIHSYPNWGTKISATKWIKLNNGTHSS